MKKIYIIVSLIFLITVPLYSQNSEKELDQIRTWFREVNSNVSHYSKAEFPEISISKDLNPDQFSIEGAKIYRFEKANMTKFFDGGLLVKLVVEISGDREELISEYYFKEGNLFFVDKVFTVYHRPKWHDEFDESEKSISKNRFYFKDNQLIRWVNPELQSVGKMDPSYKKHESAILNDVNLYIGVN